MLELVVDEDELVRRLSGRRMLVDGEWCSATTTSPRPSGTGCEVYREQTAPLSGFYEPAGLLSRIDAIGAVEEVTARALEALGRRRHAGQPSSD